MYSFWSFQLNCSLFTLFESVCKNWVIQLPWVFNSKRAPKPVFELFLLYSFFRALLGIMSTKLFPLLKEAFVCTLWKNYPLLKKVFLLDWYMKIVYRQSTLRYVRHIFASLSSNSSRLLCKKCDIGSQSGGTGCYRGGQNIVLYL